MTFSTLFHALLEAEAHFNLLAIQCYMQQNILFNLDFRVLIKTYGPISTM